jgi:hypothetical protein
MGALRWLGVAATAGTAGLACAAPARALELPCRHEDVLAEVAAGFLLSGRAVNPAELVPAARSAGFDGVALHAHEGLDDAALGEWLRGLSERADGPLVCGEASSGTRRLVLVSVRGGELWREANGVLHGRLAPGFRAPHLVVEGADGRVQRIDVGVARLEQGVRLPAELAAQRVQLVAEGPQGPRPVAELLLDAQAAAEAAVAPPPDAAGHGPRVLPADALGARLDGFRQREGAGSLRPNQALAVSAQGHAQRVCELGKIGHRVDQGQDPETRLREAHIAARNVGEAVARADSADAALGAIFGSPSHRLAVLDRRFTDVGIGQAVDDKGHTCLVVLLAAWPRRLP